MAIAEIHVTLKPTLLDTQGATVLKALRQLGHSQVQDVRIGKHIQIEVDDALTGAALQSQLELMCRELLANPVIEDYSITIGGAPVAGSATAQNTAGLSGAAVSPVVAATDTVPNPQPLRSSGAQTPDAQAAQVSAPRVTSPQNIIAPPTSDAGVSVLTSATPSAAPEAAAASAQNLPNPFALDYAAYNALSSDDKLALQGRIWETHGAWILNELNARRAAWILCVGQRVIESGDTIDSYPDDARLAALGTTNEVAPFVFTRPPQP